MRGISGLFSDISVCSPDTGILFKGKSIPDLKATFPTVVENGEPMYNIFIF